MVQFGLCTSPEQTAAAAAAGWDYFEGHAQQLFEGHQSDRDWSGARRIEAAALPMPAANCLVPSELKIVGESVDHDRLRAYLANVIRRSAACGARVLVFGSGTARTVPEGFHPDKARDQILRFITDALSIAAPMGIMLAVEPLNRGECNIINTLSEACEYVAAVGHPNFRCVLDTYHFWLEHDRLDAAQEVVSTIGHVHVADKIGRVAPGQSGQSDYRPLFSLLKSGDYRGMISVEASQFIDAPASYATVLQFLRAQWQNA